MRSLNQIGREVVRRLVNDKMCDTLTAIRFFYNSALYEDMEKSSDWQAASTDDIYRKFRQEYIRP